MRSCFLNKSNIQKIQSFIVFDQMKLPSEQLLWKRAELSKLLFLIASTTTNNVASATTHTAATYFLYIFVERFVPCIYLSICDDIFFKAFQINLNSHQQNHDMK